MSRQTRDRRAEIGRVDDGRLAGRELLDVAAEERRAGAADLQPRLAVAGRGRPGRAARSSRTRGR